MVELKQKTVGEIRKNYLDLAGTSFANARTIFDYRVADGFLMAFEFTLEPGSTVKREYMKKKEDISNEKQENIRKWNVWKEKLGYLEQADVEVERNKIEIASIGELLNYCWELSNKSGLFND